MAGIAAFYFLRKKSDFESLIGFNLLSRLYDRPVAQEFNTP